MQYKIISSENPGSLGEAVQLELSRGWRPVGGAFHGDGWFHQTVILVEPDPPEPTQEERNQVIRKALIDVAMDSDMPPPVARDENVAGC